MTTNWLSTTRSAWAALVAALLTSQAPAQQVILTEDFYRSLEIIARPDGTANTVNWVIRTSNSLNHAFTAVPKPEGGSLSVSIHGAYTDSLTPTGSGFVELMNFVPSRPGPAHYGLEFNWIFETENDDHGHTGDRALFFYGTSADQLTFITLGNDIDRSGYHSEPLDEFIYHTEALKPYVYGWRLYSDLDNTPATLTIYNFAAPAYAPEPSPLLLIIPLITALFFIDRSRRASPPARC